MLLGNGEGKALVSHHSCHHRWPCWLQGASFCSSNGCFSTPSHQRHWEQQALPPGFSVLSHLALHPSPPQDKVALDWPLLLFKCASSSWGSTGRSVTPTADRDYQGSNWKQAPCRGERKFWGVQIEEVGRRNILALLPACPTEYS